MPDLTNFNPLPTLGQPKIKSNYLATCTILSFYHEKHRDLLQKAYDNGVPAAYTDLNFSLYIYYRLSNEDRKTWDDRIHTIQMGLTQLIIKYHQEQSTIHITENFIRRIFNDEDFLHDIIRLAQERAFDELTRQIQRTDDEHEYKTSQDRPQDRSHDRNRDKRRSKEHLD